MDSQFQTEASADPRPREQLTSGPQGLGGWLVLPHIGLYVSLLFASIQLLVTFLPIYTSDTWDILTSPESSHYDSMWAPALIFETVFNLFVVAITIWNMTLFYQKKAILPLMMILTYSISLMCSIVDYVMAMQIEEAADTVGSLTNSIIRAFGACFIWIPYFLVSKRVKNTFVN